MLIEINGCQSCPFCNNDNEYSKDQCNLDTDIFAKKWETLPSDSVHEKCPIKKHRTITVELSSWVATSERLPEIDQNDKWNKDNQITKNVLTYSKEWGMRFGRYFYMAGFWTINGVSSSNGVNVDYWVEIKPPCY